VGCPRRAPAMRSGRIPRRVRVGRVRARIRGRTLVRVQVQVRAGKCSPPARRGGPACVFACLPFLHFVVAAFSRLLFCHILALQRERTFRPCPHVFGVRQRVLVRIRTEARPSEPELCPCVLGPRGRSTSSPPPHSLKLKLVRTRPQPWPALYVCVPEFVCNPKLVCSGKWHWAPA
jgi:hypothetical protein